MNSEFFEKYSHKIKTLDEVSTLLGGFPRKDKVIMCHGVFDVVHPGHVRHLVYAKSKAKILVVTLTADLHIRKGVYRPHIPERLRALNIAAFEMVDYVVIDRFETPLHSLQSLQPDFFAKGFEYSSSGMPPATKAESEIVNGYGGEMIFTPGDVVYSSSKFIDSHLPKLQLEKLLMLMDLHGITFGGLRDLVGSFKDLKIHVLGDTIVDSYTRTSLIGGQTKTPTFSVLFQGQENYIGGAGIVSQHIKAAGAGVIFSTVLGNDSLKDFVIEGLRESGIELRVIVDKSRPTTNKNAFIAGGYRLLKVDTLDNRPISDDVLSQFVEQIRGTSADAIVFSDFRHGIFSKATVKPLTNAIPQNILKVADSQVASRWGNITEFVGFDLITPNEREARFALADQDATLGMLSSSLGDITKCKALIIKLGERGIFCSTQVGDDTSVPPYFSIDSFASHIVDAVGAGDALLAYSTLTLLKKKCLVSASILGSMAAACECEYDGNIPITPKDVIAKIDSVQNMVGYSS